MLKNLDYNFMQKIIGSLFSKDLRSRKIQKNVFALAILQCISVLTSFLLVPITIGYISTSEYGIWLTISSIIGWFSLVDIGLGTGLRNRLAESLAKNDYILAKKYVSTTYLSLGLCVGVLFVCLISVNRYINWSLLLNQPQDINYLLTKTMYIVLSFLGVRLVVQLIGVVLTAHLLPAVATAINTFSNVCILIIIWILSKTMSGNLSILAFVLSSIPVFMYILVSLFLFLGKYKHIAPSLKYFDKKLVGSLMKLGIGFFFIKISMIILFQTSNILIIHLFTNDDVVVYNVAYKLFSIIFMMFDIIVQPFWTGYTDAWVKKDFVWIKHTIHKLLNIWKIIMLFAVIILILSPFIYDIWIGGQVDVPFSLSVCLCLYFICRCYGGTYNMFINGTGKIKLQSVLLAVVVVLYVPLVLFFVKVLNIGVLSIPLALICSNFYSLFIARIQYNKLIEGKAIGIWNK